jgi:hypothetical protein
MEETMICDLSDGGGVAGRDMSPSRKELGPDMQFSTGKNGRVKGLGSAAVA